MNENYDEKYWKKYSCPKMDCRKNSCKCGLAYVNIPTALEPSTPAVNGAYCNAIVEYEGSGDIYVYSKEGVPVLLNGAPSPSPEDPIINLSVAFDDASWQGARGDYIVTPGVGGGEVYVGSSALYPAEGNSGLFVNDETGEFVTVAQAYEMIDSGKKVRFNHVPVGRDLLNPSLNTALGWFDGVELSVKYSTTLDGATITCYTGSVFHPINNMAPPMGITIKKRSEGAEDEYEFIVQGKIND